MKSPSEVSEEIEILSAEIHKCYCRAYERRFGKPYWTNGDYSKLDEATKDYDREMARFVMARDKENAERVKELTEANEYLLDGNTKLMNAVADNTARIKEFEAALKEIAETATSVRVSNIALNVLSPDPKKEG